MTLQNSKLIQRSIFFISLFAFSFPHLGSAQERLQGTYDSKRKSFQVEGKNYEINDFRHGFSKYYVGDLYGVIDTTGRIVCQPKYYEVEGYMGGLSRVTMKAEPWELTYGFIDEQGQ
jgi:hypothetical protein